MTCTIEMTAQENSSSPTTAPVSPTLKPGRRYLSVIAHVSGENVQRLEEWKRAVAGGAVAPISTHVTVYLTELNESLMVAVQSPQFREPANGRCSSHQKAGHRRYGLPQQCQ